MTAPASRTLVNGRPADVVSVRDRGFTLGDGLFETIAIRSGRIRFWQEHVQRLTEGCRRLGLPPPDMELLRGELEQLRAGDTDGTGRITCTRGEGMRGYAPPRDPRPTRVVTWYPGLPALPPRPIRLRWCSTPLGENPELAGLKHLNRLEQVLARAEWDDPDIDEGVMCSVAGDVIECTSGNLFLVAEGSLQTPDLERCGVAGVVRRRVLALAREQSIPVSITRITCAQVMAADELFVTNVTRGIAAVGRLAERELSAPGPLTCRLQDALEQSAS